MTDTIRTRILASLRGRGEDGRTARELAGELEMSGVYAISHVNHLLRSLGDRGHARPASESSGYNNSRRLRWFITAAGEAELTRLLTTEPRQLAREREAAARRAREQLALRQKELLAEWQQRWQLGEVADRDGLIRWLRQEGCYLDDIGKIFSLSRERIRQICKEAW